MKKNIKKMCALVAALAMIMSLVSVSASAWDLSYAGSGTPLYYSVLTAKFAARTWGISSITNNISKNTGSPSISVRYSETSGYPLGSNSHVATVGKKKTNFSGTPAPNGYQGQFTVDMQNYVGMITTSITGANEVTMS